MEGHTVECLSLFFSETFDAPAGFVFDIPYDGFGWNGFFELIDISLLGFIIRKP